MRPAPHFHGTTEPICKRLWATTTQSAATGSTITDSGNQCGRPTASFRPCRRPRTTAHPPTQPAPAAAQRRARASGRGAKPTTSLAVAPAIRRRRWQPPIIAAATAYHTQWPATPPTPAPKWTGRTRRRDWRGSAAPGPRRSRRAPPPKPHTHRHRRIHTLHVGLVNQDLTGTSAQCLHLQLLQVLASLQLLDLAVQVGDGGHGVGCGSDWQLPTVGGKVGDTPDLPSSQQCWLASLHQHSTW